MIANFAKISRQKSWNYNSDTAADSDGSNLRRMKLMIEIVDVHENSNELWNNKNGVMRVRSSVFLINYGISHFLCGVLFIEKIFINFFSEFIRKDLLMII